MEAREERLVVLHLQQGGLIPLRISQKEETSGWKSGLGRGRSSRVPLKDVVHFTQELAALLKAGLPLDRSLQALQEVTSRPAMKDILAQVLRDLQGGKSLSDSLGRHRAFSSLYVSLVEAGETGGFLDEALDRLGDYLKTVSEFRSYLLTALIYPMILAGVGVPLPHPHAPLRGAPLRGFFQGDGPEPLLEHQLPAGPEPGISLLLVGWPDCWRPWRR